MSNHLDDRNISSLADKLIITTHSTRLNLHAMAVVSQHRIIRQLPEPRQGTMGLTSGANR